MMVKLLVATDFTSRPCRAKLLPREASYEASVGLGNTQRRQVYREVRRSLRSAVERGTWPWLVRSHKSGKASIVCDNPIVGTVEQSKGA